LADSGTAARSLAGVDRAGPALATLTLSAFVVGTCELVVVGLLDRIAADTDVSISAAGQVVTAYALGIGFGGPVVAALTTRMRRPALLVASMAAFLAGNALTAASVTYGMLLAARIATVAIALPATWATRRLQPVKAQPEPATPAVATACHAMCLVEAGKAATSMQSEPAAGLR
jgi:predicted MFS family arabinose efflux permease